MAEDVLPPESDQYLLQCPICLERFQQPKSLPCLHSFCQDCLGTYITKELSGEMASATSFPCPICRRTTSPVKHAETKDTWAEQFPTNNVIKDLIQLREPFSEPLYCKPCQIKGNMTIAAKFFCKMMNTSFCETCKSQFHDSIHNECDIRDITKFDVKQQTEEKLVPRCDTHGKKIVWFCENHKLLGCNICIIKEHRLCKQVKTATEYYHELKTGSQLADIKMALEEGTEAMKLLIKEFDEQLRIMVQNQETAVESVENLRKNIDRRLDKLQKAVTEELARLFKEEKRNIETTSLQCERLMKSMLNTMKSSVEAIHGNDNIETIVLYQRGQAEVESCEALFTEISKSFTPVSIKHEINPDIVILGDNALGKVVIEKQFRSQSNFASPMLGRRVKEIRKFDIKTPSDPIDCNARGVLYLQDSQILISDSNNKKLKLFTDTGRYLDELVMEGYPCDLCLVDNHTVAVAVFSPGGVHVVKVENSKLSLSSAVDMPRGNHCYGITHRKGKFVVGAYDGEVYNLTPEGVTNLLHKYSDTCYSLASDPVTEDTLISVCSETDGDYAVSRLSTEQSRTDLMKVGVVRRAVGLDTDREGNIYVCGRDSHNVVQMSGVGTHVRELLTSSDGINRPLAIAVRGDRLIITAVRSNEVRVFRLY